MRFKLSFSLFFCSALFLSRAQINFDDYKTLRSSGDIPADFSQSTLEKMEEAVKNSDRAMSNKLKEEFYQGVNYAIDDILHGGNVIYGDPITNYVNEIIDRLLKDDKDLRDDIRVYTIKSNAPNAFATDQGILFVTTGLVSRIGSEAQLAYVLSHEISHYKLKHVVQTFEFQKEKKNKSSQTISNLSKYSRDKEFEADGNGVAWYQKAGYSLKAINETFDMLAYSHLPFAEVSLPRTYFSSNKLFVPESLFPTKEYEIRADEDEDDSESSHPNIKKRKEAVAKEIEKFADWGTTEFFLGETRFKEVRSIARFENVRSNILDGNYGDALYSIFLLEREFPASSYLLRMKSQAWLNLLALVNDKGESAKKVYNVKESSLQGKSADLHVLLENLNPSALTTFALRQIYDLQAANQNSEELAMIYNSSVELLAKNPVFKLEEYFKETFDGKDTSKFYLYGLSDLVQDDKFVARYNEEKGIFNDETAQLEAFKSLKKGKKKKAMKEYSTNKLHIGMDNAILVEPKVFSYNVNMRKRTSKFNLEKSLELEGAYSEAFEESSKALNMNVHQVDRRTIATGGTVEFNERSALISYLEQWFNSPSENTFPVDYEVLNEIRASYGTDRVLFTIVEHNSRRKDFGLGGSIILTLILPPAGTAMAAKSILWRNQTTLNMLVLDLKEGTIEMANSQSFNEPVSKANLAFHAYDLLYKLKLKR